MFWMTLFVALSLVIEQQRGVIDFIVFILFAVSFGAPIAFRRRTTPFEYAVCRSVAAYLTVSIATLPFLDDWWIGELPAFALLQAPKTEVASWFANRIIYDVIVPLGWTAGSWSPDLITAKPIGLALAYAVPLAVLFAFVAWRTRFATRYRYWLAAIFVLAIVDYVMMRCFACGPGLTIY